MQKVKIYRVSNEALAAHQSKTPPTYHTARAYFPYRGGNITPATKSLQDLPNDPAFIGFKPCSESADDVVILFSDGSSFIESASYFELCERPLEHKTA
jgi:hypothetical protein